jgi:hypothetical protein
VLGVVSGVVAGAAVAAPAGAAPAAPAVVDVDVEPSAIQPVRASTPVTPAAPAAMRARCAG